MAIWKGSHNPTERGLILLTMVISHVSKSWEPILQAARCSFLLDEVEAQLTVFLRRRHGDGPDLAVLAIRGTQDVHETGIFEMMTGPWKGATFTIKMNQMKVNNISYMGPLG